MAKTQPVSTIYINALDATHKPAVHTTLCILVRQDEMGSDQKTITSAADKGAGQFQFSGLLNGEYYVLLHDTILGWKNDHIVIGSDNKPFTIVYDGVYEDAASVIAPNILSTTTPAIEARSLTKTPVATPVAPVQHKPDHTCTEFVSEEPEVEQQIETFKDHTVTIRGFFQERLITKLKFCICQVTFEDDGTTKFEIESLCSKTIHTVAKTIEPSNGKLVNGVLTLHLTKGLYVIHGDASFLMHGKYVTLNGSTFFVVSDTDEALDINIPFDFEATDGKEHYALKKRVEAQQGAAVSYVIDIKNLQSIHKYCLYCEIKQGHRLLHLKSRLLDIIPDKEGNNGTAELHLLNSETARIAAGNFSLNVRAVKTSPHR